MCGLVVWWDPKVGASQQTFRDALDLQVHRGPDFTGAEFFEKVWLGHNRLSILDLSEQGHQPMSDGSGRYFIVYNGEVYNYVELRSELIDLGHTFSSTTDTEVILRAYIQWEERAFNRLNGMWSLAIWDAVAEKLVVSRDRFGVKPLYYVRIGEGVAFASEIKPLLALQEEQPMANYEAIARFFYDGNVDGQEETWFSGVRRFPASHILELGKGQEIWSKYWELNENIQPEDLDFDKLIKNAVEISLRSDVPVGVCLSGGIDSSTIAVLSEKKQAIKSFTARHNDSSSDEFPSVLKLAEGRRIEPFSAFPDPNLMFEDASKILWHLEEPAKATGVFSQWQVMRLAQGKVKVLLDGQGGDEVFAGYSFQRWPFLKGLLLSGRWGALKQALGLWGWNYFWGQLRNEISVSLKSAFRPLLGGIWRLVSGSARTRMPWTTKFFKGYINPNFRNARAPALRNLKQRLKWDITSEMLPALLRNEDKIAMAFSLESRVPLIDVRLVEYAYSRPDTELIKNGWSKYPLRNILSQNAPLDIAWRKEKLGFPTPFNSYLAPHCDEIIYCLKNGSMVRHGILASEKVAETVESAMVDPHDRLVWHLLQTEWWLRNFIDGDFRKPLPWNFEEVEKLT